MNISEKIKQLRERSELTQQDLADMIFVTAQAVSQWENGKTVPDVDRLSQIASALNTSVENLLGEDRLYFTDLPVRETMFSAEHMYARLKTFAESEGLELTYKALAYAKEKHLGQTRKPSKGGFASVPYITHPLTVACHAHAMGICDDAILSTALLHDVCEDCGVAPEELPFPKEIQNSVALLRQHLTIQAIPNSS